MEFSECANNLEICERHGQFHKDPNIKVESSKDILLTVLFGLIFKAMIKIICSIHFIALVLFYTPRKNQKKFFFLMFAGIIKETSDLK